MGKLLGDKVPGVNNGGNHNNSNGDNQYNSNGVNQYNSNGDSQLNSNGDSQHNSNGVNQLRGSHNGDLQLEVYIQVNKPNIPLEYFPEESKEEDCIQESHNKAYIQEYQEHEDFILNDLRFLKFHNGHKSHSLFLKYLKYHKFLFSNLSQRQYNPNLSLNHSPNHNHNLLTQSVLSQ